MLLEAFPVLCARADRTWNLVHYFRVPVSGSHCSGRLGVADEYENWIFREMTFFRRSNTWLDSGYMLCVSTSVGMDEFHTFSSLRRTRLLERSFSIRFEWRSVPSRCFLLQFCSAWFALGKLDVLLEFHVTDSGDDVEHFSRSVRIFRTPPLGVESPVVMPITPLRLLTKHSV